MAVMEVGITEFRSNLRHWLVAVKAGDEVVLTERNVPVARLSGVNGLSAWEQIIRSGLITPAPNKKRTKASDLEKVPAKGSVSEIISEHRDHPMYS